MNKVILGLILSVTFAFAGQVSEGMWKQTSSTGGDCPNCKISISKVSPHIIQITSNNDLVGYAYYNQSKDNYKGAMEWKAGKGGTYKNVVFLITITYDRKTLTINAKSNSGNFTATYRK